MNSILTFIAIAAVYAFPGSIALTYTDHRYGGMVSQIYARLPWYGRVTVWALWPIVVAFLGWVWRLVHDLPEEPR